MKYFVSILGNEKNTADVKAPADMCAIMHKRGYVSIPFARPKRSGRMFALMTHFRNWSRVSRKVKQGDILVYQYPLLLSHYCVKKLINACEKKHINVVLLVHDIDSLRGYNEQTNAWKEEVFMHVPYIICHNDMMKEWFSSKGINESKLVSMGVFDYLTDEYRDDKNYQKDSVIIAGNLSKKKSAYTDALLKMDRLYTVNLYGPNFEKDDEYKKYNYFGSFPSDKLVSQLKGGYGLVWDGDSVEECSGLTGRYLQYNAPHKVSLYIASSTPVIIWKKAALASYIEEKKLGMTVNSLNEIESIIKSTSQEEYMSIYKNVKAESVKLRNGYYLNSALDRIEDTINETC